MLSFPPSRSLQQSSLLRPAAAWGGEQGTKGLKVLGVYSTKAEADGAKADLIAKHEALGQAHGHGDICVGDSWEDEISLAVKPAPLFLNL